MLSQHIPHAPGCSLGTLHLESIFWLYSYFNFQDRIFP